MAWGRGEIGTDTLTQARRLLAAGRGVGHLLPAAHAS